MVQNKKKAVEEGMYLPDKLNEIIGDIKTMNLRLRQYSIMDKDMIESSFYN